MLVPSQQFTLNEYAKPHEDGTDLVPGPKLTSDGMGMANDSRKRRYDLYAYSPPCLPSPPHSADNPRQVRSRKISDEDIVEIFKGMKQIVCKQLSKVWIKIVEPGKMSRYPYMGGEGEPPEWWPENTPHREPDHLRREDRLKVIMKLVHSDRVTKHDLLRQALRLPDRFLTGEVTDQLFGVFEALEPGIINSFVGGSVLDQVLIKPHTGQESQKPKKRRVEKNKMVCIPPLSPMVRNNASLLSPDVKNEQDIQNYLPYIIDDYETAVLDPKLLV